MPEGRDTPNRRGRRNPALLAQEEQTEQPDVAMDMALDDAGQAQPDDPPLLLPGDIVLAKSSIEMTVGGAESWFTYGVQTRIQPGEDEERAFGRVAAVVNTRVIDLAADAEDQIEQEAVRRREEERNRPIQHTRRRN